MIRCSYYGRKQDDILHRFLSITIYSSVYLDEAISKLLCISFHRTRCTVSPALYIPPHFLSLDKVHGLFYHHTTFPCISFYQTWCMVFFTTVIHFPVFPFTRQGARSFFPRYYIFLYFLSSLLSCSVFLGFPINSGQTSE